MSDEQIPVIREVGQGTAKLMPDVDRERAWLLTVDGAPQSYVDLDEPEHLEFEYVRRLAHVLDCAAEPGAALDLLHLGGGALTLPRYAAAARPGSRQDVVEFDAALVELVEQHLPLAAGAGVTVHAADARAWLEAAPETSADVLVADVFGGSRVPAQLTSVEYARHAARVLRPGGLYAANLADGAPFGFLKAQLANFAAVFAELALVAEPGCCAGGASATRCCWPRTPRCRWPPWPGGAPPTPSPPGWSRGGARPVHARGASGRRRGRGLLAAPPEGAFSLG